jgi:choline-sulfatase
VIHTLDKLGKLENTIIFFLSDHGDGGGSHQWNQKQVLYEESVNVPFIIADFRNTKAGINTRQLVNVGLDLIPTMCHYAEINQPISMAGQSQKEFVNHLQLCNEDKVVVLETTFADGKQNQGISGRCIIKGNWKYIIYDQGNKREQLFNLSKDPGEMNDLVDAPEAHAIKKNLVSLLKKWGQTTNDPVIKNLY